MCYPADATIAAHTAAQQSSWVATVPGCAKFINKGEWVRKQTEKVKCFMSFQF